ncbi:MOSC domain-containing protein [Mycobacterium sp. CBMA293]|uniref:MOSC domain-containing protein n=1 Tax=unclassified Mycolicibacterium TaxID=2636767 RepID=UPI0012DDECC4|nr:MULTISPECIES: MOSC domain-containing protein [unclassified Mycolicibacterium]MUL46458.1 MOSC domain-containing protein [Mycolicibacterium sp. CBMA 360]MUL57030.1 MOSC domain-containing protein [Mycolicibacterium sp. CBMA 335]MUL70070.1 MOSC domain-containing protein [Mycolicibacterium sp. CBMA 311]MUL92118.1 MOSC domain-containing protein [Mycolicibacterium sp. CBMA 230]MUM05856.1 sulfurase [Mycolicibacterium sp. CBMA 213]
MAQLVSVNVGMPKLVTWRDETILTGIWKMPIDGPVMVQRLNVDGDSQGDRASHGGEHRAVMVYQSESYDFWAEYLGRDDLVPGNFGENFTVSGLADDEVCIGDRFLVGDAEFEVTQPRVTCFRVGIRLNEPEMPKLLVSQRRPGFYLRVIKEGEVRAGDDIVRTQRGVHQLSIADVDALMYLPDRDVGQLRKIVEVSALSPSWRHTFRKMLVARDDALPPTAPPIGTEPQWDGFRAFEISAIRHETAAVVSIWLSAQDHRVLPKPLAGQYLTVRVPASGNPAPVRSYSISSDPACDGYRISVKREENGQVSRWLHAQAAPGVVLEAAAPRGDFYLTDEARPVVLVSAGIGVTPVLAMLHALSAAHSDREIWWVHVTRSPETHPFVAEVDMLIAALPNARNETFYTQTQGRLSRAMIAALGLPADAEAFLCGPTGFMADLRAFLVAAGLDSTRVHTETFGALPPTRPGIVSRADRTTPHSPPGPVGSGPAVTFTRSGLTVIWSADYDNVLDLAEACDVPTRFACRNGVCHVCATEIISGTVKYLRDPLDPPASGTVLICSAVPESDVVLDM